MIEVSHLWKKYNKTRLGLKERLKGYLFQSPPASFYALKDVSFQLAPGESLGIIGNNGAGKSTLLRILSRITPPTKGHALIRGRVASLLEIGTGFHPHLSGLENIYLSGAILGMSRQEIKQQLDAIVDFSGIEDFIQVPVKKYSSGMYVRLAFAVAAHLHSDIVLLDEVLAVGDMEFQKKSLAKSESLSAKGKTVVLVSHNLSAVARLCKKTLLLDEGKKVMLDHSEQVLDHYLQGYKNEKGVFIGQPSDFPQESPLFVHQVSLMDSSHHKTHCFKYSQAIEVEIDFEIRRATPGLNLGIGVGTFDHLPVFATSIRDTSGQFGCAEKKGRYRARFKIQEKWLNMGNYAMALYVTDDYSKRTFFSAEILRFSIHEDAMSPMVFQGARARKGLLQPLLPWLTEPL